MLLPFFSFMTFLIAVPTGVKFFNWIGTMWKGSLSPPIDFATSDTYFVVAHFHYVIFGTVVFAMFAGFHFWWPKMTGKMLDERLGKITFWTLFIGFHGTFLVQHWLGTNGMQRRIPPRARRRGTTSAPSPAPGRVPARRRLCAGVRCPRRPDGVRGTSTPPRTDGRNPR
ncbi:hypothetical protein GCM10010339_44600 [Streptomyces alanosinicus]|uniref:Cytochrome oxidase subunit I profile domain-containing protein n=1 Tax=Streptomyces alanosinicus TaxID=68171 RepID=A0A918YJF4_9ACTN|nr:hypothetical protein GCM10010339_44600 [Streptomyces alanosinicus]